MEKNMTGDALNPNNHNKRFDDFKASDNFWNNLHEKFHEQIGEMQRSRGVRIWILHILNNYDSKNGVEIMGPVQNHHKDFQTHKKVINTLNVPHQA
jgi:hypothetical protein